MSIVNDLRSLADFLETRPELAVLFSKDVSMYKHLSAYRDSEKAMVGRLATELKPFDKKHDSFGSITLLRSFGELMLKIEVSGVCKKVTKTVTEEREVWECPSLLELAETTKTPAVNGSL